MRRKVNPVTIYFTGGTDREPWTISYDKGFIDGIATPFVSCIHCYIYTPFEWMTM